MFDIFVLQVELIYQIKRVQLLKLSILILNYRTQFGIKLRSSRIADIKMNDRQMDRQAVGLTDRRKDRNTLLLAVLIDNELSIISQSFVSIHVHVHVAELNYRIIHNKLLLLILNRK